MQLLDSQNNVIGTFDSNSEIRVYGKRRIIAFNTKEDSTYNKLILDVDSVKNFSIKKDNGSVIKLSDSTEEVFDLIKREFISFIGKQPSIEPTTVTENNSDSETSNLSVSNDEFTYVVIPGKIQKLFVHVGNIDDITTVSEYADFKTRESIQTKDSIYDGDGKFILDVDGVVRWFNSEKSFTISDTNETVFAIDVDISESSKYSEILNNLTNDERFVSKFLEGYTAAGIDFGDKTVQDILCDQWSGAGAFIADSKVCFSAGPFYGYNGYGVYTDGITNCSDSSFDIASFIYDEEGRTDNYGNDYSETYNGIRLLQKAIETGRALDIAVPIPRESNEYSQYSDVFAQA